MGKSYTPTYRIEAFFVGKTGVSERMTFTWDTKTHGRASETNLEKWRIKYNESFGPGGVNFHVSKGEGVVIHFHTVNLIRQSTGARVHQVKMPMFEAV